jgi:hypothetical protein
MTKLQQAKIIADHYLNMHNLASSISYSLECLNNNEPCILDKEQLTNYITSCADKIKREHLKDFGIKLEREDENERM